MITFTLDLLDHFLAMNPDIERQQRFLAHQSELSSLASDAAAMAFEAGKVELAVELFERGRNLLLSRQRGYRTEWKETSVDLKERFDKLSAKLEESAVKSTRPDSTLSDDREVTDEMRLDQLLKFHRRLMKEWGVVVAEIRSLPGMSHFLKSTPFSELKKVASEGPSHHCQCEPSAFRRCHPSFCGASAYSFREFTVGAESRSHQILTPSCSL